MANEDLAWRDAGVRVARADLGYVSSLTGQSALSGLSLFPYATLVAYETDQLLTRFHGETSVLQGSPMAVAARMAGKIFDDKKASLDEIADTLRDLSAANEHQFRGGMRRSVARALRIFNPDLSVFMLDGKPLLHGGVLPFQLGLHALGSAQLPKLGPLVGSLAESVGTLAAALGVGLHEHRGEPDLAGRIYALDAVSSEYEEAAFAGLASPAEVLLLSLLQNNLAVGARLAHSSCCDSCESAALKHKFIAAYHSARSLQLAGDSDVVAQTLREKLAAIAASESASVLLAHRALRNSLLHLGLSDRPGHVVAAADPIRALVEQDFDCDWTTAAGAIRRAAEDLDDRLVDLLLADRAALLRCLHEPPV